MSRQRNGTRRAQWCAGLVLLAAWGFTAIGQNVAYPPGGEGGTEAPTVPEDGGQVLTPEELLRIRKLRAITADVNARQTTHFFMRSLLVRMVRHALPARGTLRARGFRQAGPWFDNFEINADLAYGGMRLTNLDASGSLVEESLSFGGDLGSRIHIGGTVHSNRTRIRGAYGTETGTTGGDAYINLDVNRILSFGLFGTASAVDVEDINGNGSIWGGGGTASVVFSCAGTDITLTGALTGLSQDVTEREYDTTASGVIDVSRSWTDWFSTSAFGYFSDSLRNHLPGDRCFWSAGLDFTFIASDRLSFVVGWEKTFALNDYRDYRIHAGLSWSW